MTTVPLDITIQPKDVEAADLFCLGCGYDLRGLLGDADPDARCPECGRRFDPAEHAGLRAPWPYRSRAGAWNAYWHTAALVTFRPAEFAARFRWAQVRHHGSPAFRSITVASAAAAVVLAAAAGAWHARLTGVGVAILLAALVPTTLAFFYAATDLAGFFTGPRLASDTSEEAFRAQIVNDYASAALAWVPLPALAACGAAVLEKLSAGHAAEYALSAATVLTFAVCMLWVGNVLVLFGKALELRPASLVLAAVFFPLRCAGVAILSVLFVFAPIACCVGGLISLRP